MIRLDIRETLAIDKDRLFRVITRYEDYSQFLYGVKSVRVERKGRGKARAKCHLSIFKSIVFTMDLLEDPGLGIVKWKLLESDVFESNTGFWRLKDFGSNKCEVQFRLDLEFKVPIPDFLLERLLKFAFSSMLKCFEAQARRDARRAS